MPPTTISDAREAALAFLYGRIDYERTPPVPYRVQEFKLDRMEELLDRLGRPESGLPIVHVAGTKGKGSTSAMIAAVLSAAGLRTGLFTSPHLDRLEERMTIDGRQCSAEEFVELMQRVRAAAEAMDSPRSADDDSCGPTYFELTTALALLHFAAHQVEAAVLEVGMGGRLDSTNVCRPRVSVITTISFDHTKQLGNTLAAIAREKAGIIKPGVPVVSGVLPDEPRSVIEQVAREVGSPLIQLDRDFEFAYQPPQAVDVYAGLGRIDFFTRQTGAEQHLAGLKFGLLGRHQAHNAAVALAAICELARQGWSIPEAAIRRGLADVRWPARVEVVGRRPTVIIDAAHNVASVAALIETLSESFSPRRRVLVFATTRDKDVPGMLRLLLPQFDEVILTRYTNNPRFVPPEELLALAREISPRPAQVCLDPASAWRAARSLAAAEDLICVTGSFFIAAEIRREIG